MILGKLEIRASERKQYWEEKGRNIEEFLNSSDEDEERNEEVILYAAELHQEFFQLVTFVLVARKYGSE